MKTISASRRACLLGCNLYGPLDPLGFLQARLGPLDPWRTLATQSTLARRHVPDGSDAPVAIQAIADTGFRYQELWLAWVGLDLLTQLSH
jgi:hypothetical protein